MQLEHLNAEKNKLTKEKIDLENVLEAEQEYIVNKLQKQVSNPFASCELLMCSQAIVLKRRIDHCAVGTAWVACKTVIVPWSFKP